MGKGRTVEKISRRLANPTLPVKTLQPDLDGVSASELKEIGEVAALRALIEQTRNPTRHATAVVSAAGKLLEFSSKKPTTETNVNQKFTGTLEMSDAKRDLVDRVNRAVAAITASGNPRPN